MPYNARKRKNRRTLKTGKALRGMFGNRRRRPCSYCGAKLTLDQATFDHVKALSQGGYDKRKNGAIACRQCNAKKGAMSVDLFRSLMAKGAG
jgi:5-methylcytosine-specific restriction endonuclease McrA